MGQKKSFQEFADSQHELKDFMDAIDESDDMADVTVRKKGSLVYSEQCQVFERIETNYSHVDIVWNGDKKNSDFPYYVTYRNDYQTFEAFENRLVIKAEDKNGDTIEIEIRKQPK